MKVVAFFLLFLQLQQVTGQQLSPPYHNLAEGKDVYATATCGEGVFERERFCELTGAHPNAILDFSHHVIRGQVCDYCDPTDPAKAHPASQAVDGTERWWQSPPLSRNRKFNEVNFTIPLGQEFHVAYVLIKMANSPRPGVFALERSTDNGQTFKAWQYFADTQQDCFEYFSGFETDITAVNSVVCTTDYSKVLPLTDGEIVISLVNGRPGAMNFTQSSELQDWTRATDVRLRLLRTKTLLGHLMGKARGDETVTRRYFYSIKDISIGGRCLCNGHAAACDVPHPVDPGGLVCRCEHNTCGYNCEKCCDGFTQKAWRPATFNNTHECERCNCHGHSDYCYFDQYVADNKQSLDMHGNYEGGGVCINCQHNTAGNNCEKCERGYYRDDRFPIESHWACQPCQCDGRFTSGDCMDGTGECICRPEYTGPNCESCNVGYYDFPFCFQCDCNVNGTRDQICEVDGAQCPCKLFVEGLYCDRCVTGYHGFPDCKRCSCDLYGSDDEYCEAGSGQCRCRPGFAGLKCDSCAAGYQDYPRCSECQCDYEGAFSETCNDLGMCECVNDRIEGSRCDRCKEGNTNFPLCTECDCHEIGAASQDCATHYGCLCHPRFGGPKCDECSDGFFNFPECKGCDCDGLGSVTCDKYTGACLCLPGVVGARCDQCAPYHFGLHTGQGCFECDCAEASSGYCDESTGQCACHAGVQGRRCDQCVQGHYNYTQNGCLRCDCDFPEAIYCRPDTGQCVCLAGAIDRRCYEVPCPDCTYPTPDPNPNPNPNPGPYPEQRCDECVGMLLVKLAEADFNLTALTFELKDVLVHANDTARLNAINETVFDLWPLIDQLDIPQNASLDPYFELVHQLQIMVSNVSDKADNVNEAADAVLKNSTMTKTDAQDIVIEAEEAAKHANASVDYANYIFESIVGNIISVNISSMVQQAEDMLLDIQGRVFGAEDNHAVKELRTANETLDRTKDLLDKAMEQQLFVNESYDILNQINEKLNDIMSQTNGSKDNSMEAMELTAGSQTKLNRTRDLIDLLDTLYAKINMTMDMARDVVQDAKGLINDTTQNIRDIERESSRLEPAMEDLKDFVDNTTSSNLELSILVDNATEYAEKLARQAERMKELLKDTQPGAEGAVNAIKAYENITLFVNQANESSVLALDAAMQALNFTLNLREMANASLIRSETIKRIAINTRLEVSEVLRPRHTKAFDEMVSVGKLYRVNTDRLVGINGGMFFLKGPFAGRAKRASQMLEQALEKFEAVINRTEEIRSKLPEKQKMADELEENVQNVTRATDDASKLVEAALNKLPDLKVIERVTQLAEKNNETGLQIGLDIAALEDLIKFAREEANQIKVGVTFDDKITLSVREPLSLQDLGSYSRLSLFFKTDQDDGLLAYIGPDASTGLMKDDYMALEIIGGKTSFKFDLGAGPASVTNPRRVSDDQWHEVIVERWGKKANVTIRTMDENNVIVSTEATGPFSVLDLKPSTKFFIGGASDQAGIETHVSSIRFIGCIDDVKLNNKPVGLWNFKDEENLTGKGCQARNVLSGENLRGFHFEGDGYVIIDKFKFNPSRTAQIGIKFKTTAEDGLIFLMGHPEEKTFLTIQLKGGKLVLMYNLGSGTATVESKNTFNDGQWHKVVASTIAQDSILQVDGNTEGGGRSPGAMNRLSTTNEIYLGGFTGENPYSVPVPRLKGCIETVFLGSTERDILNENLDSQGVSPGCPEDMVRVALYQEDAAKAYVVTEPVSIDIDTHLTLKFRTKRSSGLLLYVADDTQSNALSVSLLDGKLVVSVTSEEQVFHLDSDSTYDDGKWHYLSVTKKNKEISLTVDDMEMKNGKYEGKKKVTTTTPLYIGGVPDDYKPFPGNTRSLEPFAGCLGDVTMNDRLINMNVVPSLRAGVELTGCDAPDDPSPVPIPDKPTTPAGTKTTTTSKPIQTTTTNKVTTTENQQCTLQPMSPDAQPGDNSTGWRFGGYPYSRLEITVGDDALKDTFRTESDVVMSFKTWSPDGTLLYGSDSNQDMYIYLYIADGKLHFAFNNGDEDVTMSSVDRYNDNNWHQVNVYRKRKVGTLTVDGNLVAESKSTAKAKYMRIQDPLYIGRALHKADPYGERFVGCIKEIEVRGQKPEPPAETLTRTCTDDVEPGNYFYDQGGYIRLNDNVTIGTELDVSLVIRPRSTSGVLFVSTAPDHSILIQMKDGQVEFIVKYGNEEVQTTYLPEKTTDLCDGNSYEIRAVKDIDKITLYVDGMAVRPSVGSLSDTPISEITIGGLPQGAQLDGATKESYQGCILVKSIEIDGTPLAPNNVLPIGNVEENFCPSP